jgi:hypothetical protein
MSTTYRLPTYVNGPAIPSPAPAAGGGIRVTPIEPDGPDAEADANFTKSDFETALGKIKKEPERADGAD